MLKKQCTYGGCKATVDVNAEQPRCEKHQYAHQEKKVYHSHQMHRERYFYGTSEWKKLRNQYMQHNPFCELCDKRGVVEAGHTVDHIKEIQDGGEKLEWSNLQTLCEPCHKIKTGQEVRKRERRKKNNGFDNISDH